MPRLRLTFLIFIALTLAIGSSAFADTIFYLTVPENSCSGNSCAPAGTVQVDVDLLTSSTATVTFTGQTVGGNAYSMYDVLFEVNGSFDITKYVVTGGSAAGTVTAPANTPGSLDLYGTFSEESEVVHDASEVEFYLGGGSWTSSANVLTTTPLPNGNAGGYAQPFDAAAQVRVTDCTSSTEPGCRDVDNGHEGAIMDTAGFETTSSVPEPASVVLLISLLAIVAIAYRRKQIA
jgi:hypothetical protein